MNSNVTPLLFTASAYELMEKEFARLTEERAAVMLRLQAAREMGDLSENGAYKYAKIEIGTINRLLRELKYKISQGQVVTPKAFYSIVEFGCKVTLKSSTTTQVYTMVGKYESNPAENKISVESPLGVAILGKKKGDVVKVTTPRGEVTYEIVEIT